jgi:ATP-dependent DNA helicase RecQ
MFVRVITLRFAPVSGIFDDSPLRDFLKDKEVLSIRDHFFIKHEVPYEGEGANLCPGIV